MCLISEAKHLYTYNGIVGHLTRQSRVELFSPLYVYVLFVSYPLDGLLLHVTQGWAVLPALAKRSARRQARVLREVW